MKIVVRAQTKFGFTQGAVHTRYYDQPGLRHFTTFHRGYGKPEVLVHVTEVDNCFVSRRDYFLVQEGL